MWEVDLINASINMKNYAFYRKSYQTLKVLLKVKYVSLILEEKNNGIFKKYIAKYRI